MDRKFRIYVDSTGEGWGSDGEIRLATEEDVDEWGDEYGIELGDVISTYGWEDFECGDGLLYVHVSDEELNEMVDGECIYPRKLHDFWNRARSVVDDVVTIQRLWRCRNLKE
jgi:hypothetical protein